MFRNRPVSLTLIGLFLWLTGCTSWTSIGISEVADHGKVRVTLMDGSQESIYEPWVEADSIKGHQYIETLAFPVDQVAGLESHSTNEVATVLAVLGGLVAVILIAGVISCAASDTPQYGCPF